jgi:hypothetical protein
MGLIRFVRRGITAAKPSPASQPSDLKRLHSANLQYNTEQRLAVAQAQGNALLIALLERELAIARI